MVVTTPRTSAMSPLALFLAFAVIAVAVVSARAQSGSKSIRYLEDRKLWILHTDHTSYALGVNERNELQHMYWGNHLTRDVDLSPAHSAKEWASFDSSETDTNGEYQGWGDRVYSEPCLKVALADGDRDLVLHYLSNKIKGDTLTLRLKDIQYDLEVDLVYRVFPHEDILRKEATITNRTAQPITIESAQSGVWYVPRGEGYRLTYLVGRWADETQLTREEIHQGKILLDSRRGNTGLQINPWFAIDGGSRPDDRATEQHGHVWFGALGWSGNWKLVVEESPAQQVRVVGGYNDFDFGYLLEARREPCYAALLWRVHRRRIRRGLAPAAPP